MAEKRKHKRIPLHYYLKVSDTDSKKHLGYMIDVSQNGFKLLSEEQIPEGSELVCTLKLPEVLNDKEEISFKATACWSGRDVNPNYFVSGYHIKKIKPDGEIIIAMIIKNYGHNV